MNVKLQSALILGAACLALALGLGGLASAQDESVDLNDADQRKQLAEAIKMMEEAPKDRLGTWVFGDPDDVIWALGKDGNLRWANPGNFWSGKSEDPFANSNFFQRYRWSDGDQRSWGRGTSIQVENNNGDVKVLVNGEPVDATRLKETDDTIVIYNEDGEVLHKILKGGQGNWSTHLFQNSQNQGPTKRPTIGLHMEPVPESLAFHLEVPAGSSILVGSVIEGQPAHEAGLAKFDVITRVDGKAGVTMDELREAVASKKAGDRLELRVLRRGEPLKVNITVEEQETQAGAPQLRQLPLMGRLFSDNELTWQTIPNARSAPFWTRPESAGPAGGASLETIEDRLERLEKIIERIEQRIDKRF